MKYKEYLLTLLETMPISNILEIGVFEGKFGRKMLQTIHNSRPNSDIRYMGIDIFDDMNQEIVEKENSLFAPSKDIVERYLKKECSFAEIDLLKGFSNISLPKIKDKIHLFDLIYIDGGHSIETISSEWKYIKQHINKNCIVVFDDYYEGNNEIGAKSVVDEINQSIFKVQLTDAKRYDTETGVFDVKQAIVTYLSRFDIENEDKAKNVILEKLDDKKRNWEIETNELQNLLRPYLNKEYSVCDFGCGTGRVSKAIANYVKDVYAIDKSEKMLEILSRNIKREDINNIHELNLVKYMKLEYKYDLILAIFVLQHIPLEMLHIILEKFQKTCHEKTKLIVINTPDRHVVDGVDYVNDGIEIKSLIEEYFIKVSDINIDSLGNEVSSNHFASIYTKRLI